MKCAHERIGYTCMSVSDMYSVLKSFKHINNIIGIMRFVKLYQITNN